MHNANDAKTFLKHFGDCLFYFCSSCADSINNGELLWLSGCRSSSVQSSVGAGSAEFVSSCDTAVLRLPGCRTPSSTDHSEGVPALPAQLRLTPIHQRPSACVWSAVCMWNSDESVELKKHTRMQIIYFFMFTICMFELFFSNKTTENGVGFFTHWVASQFAGKITFCQQWFLQGSHGS